MVESPFCLDQGEACTGSSHICAKLTSEKLVSWVRENAVFLHPFFKGVNFLFGESLMFFKCIIHQKWGMGICLLCRRPEAPNPRKLCGKLPGCSWTKDLDENFQGGSARAQFFCWAMVSMMGTPIQETQGSDHWTTMWAHASKVPRGQSWRFYLGQVGWSSNIGIQHFTNMRISPGKIEYTYSSASRRISPAKKTVSVCIFEYSLYKGPGNS